MQLNWSIPFHNTKSVNSVHFLWLRKIVPPSYVIILFDHDPLWSSAYPIIATLNL